MLDVGCWTLVDAGEVDAEFLIKST